MSIDQRVRVAVRDLADVVPVDPPPPEAVRARAERSAVSARSGHPPVRVAGRRLAPALAAAAVVAVVATAGLIPRWVSPTSPPGPAGTVVGEPVLPKRFAGKTWRTASVKAAPPGPAIAIFEHGGADTVDEPVVVGANGHTYRVLDDFSRLTNAGSDPVLLAPDGSALAGGGGSFLDLTTGELTVQSVLPGDGLRSWSPTAPLAWSPDGRWLVYGGIPVRFVPEVPGRPDDLAGLALLDRANGRVEFINTGGGAAYPQAAFSPDSTELAISTTVDMDGPGAETVIRIFDRSGTMVRELIPPDGHLLTPYGTAWSPDGTLLVVQDPQRPQGWAFVDATGTGRIPFPVSAGLPYPVELVGWRGPDTLLVGAHQEPGRGSGVPGSLGWLMEVPRVGGAAHLVSEFPDGEDDRIGNLRLAAGLLPAAEIRDAGRPDHGPVPVAYRLLVVTVIGFVVLLAAVLVWRWWRVRRRAP